MRIRPPVRFALRFEKSVDHDSLELACSVSNGVTETTTTTTESTGTITEFTPGHHLFLQTEAAQPVQYKFGKTVTYVTSDGKVIEASKIRKDSKVRVHYIKDGDDMLVDKVIVTQDRD
jgi:hypothetical protein